MPNGRLAPLARITACAALTLCLLSPAHAADAGGDQLHLRIDGVTGDGSVSSPLGKDAFPLRNFTVPVGMQDDAGAPLEPGPPRPEDVKFQLSPTSPAVLLWQLALERKVVPKASLAALDAQGKVRYRIDLEQVVVRNLSLQTFGQAREVLLGSLAYERIRFTRGEGKDALVAGWDRVRNQPWK